MHKQKITKISKLNSPRMLLQGFLFQRNTLLARQALKSRLSLFILTLHECNLGKVKNTAKGGCCGRNSKDTNQLRNKQSIATKTFSTQSITVINRRRSEGNHSRDCEKSFAVFKNNQDSDVTFKRVAEGSCATNVCCWRRIDSLADINAIPQMACVNSRIRRQ